LYLAVAEENSLCAVCIRANKINSKEN